MRYTPRGTRTFRPGQTTQTFGGPNRYFEPPGTPPAATPIVWSDNPPPGGIQVLSDPPPGTTDPSP